MPDSKITSQKTKTSPRGGESPHPSLEDADFAEGSETSGLGGVAGKLQEIPWFKKNPNVVKGVAAGALVSLIVLILGWHLGWFHENGGGATASPPLGASPSLVAPPPVNTAAPEANKALASSNVVVTQPSQTVVTSQPAPPAPNSSEPPKDQPPPLPDDITKWKGPDYHRARKENHAKLLEAIVHLGNKFRGSTPAAKGLTDLLKPLPVSVATLPSASPATPPGLAPTPNGPSNAAPAAPSSRPYAPTDLAKLVETIVEALGCNGSETARRTLEEILAGQFATDDDKVAVEAALKTLAAHPCPENDALLLRAITNAGALRPAERAGDWPSKDLEAKAFEVAKTAASGELRAMLAEALVLRRAKLDSKDPLVEFLLAADLRNCAAQVVLCERADLSTETKEMLEQHLADYSSKAMAHYLGVPEDAQASSSAGGVLSAPVPIPTDRNASPAAKADKDATAPPFRAVAAQLWSAKGLALLEPRVAKVSLSEKPPSLLLLAATIPQDSARAAMAKIFRKHWHEGPKSLESAGLFERFVTDPGLIVLVKSYPRRELKTSRTSGKAGSAGAPSGGARITEAAQKKVQAEQEWMEASSKLVAACCQRFQAAAEAKAKSEGEGAAMPIPAALAQLPPGFQLPPAAQVAASYHLTWPADASPDLAKLTPGWLDLYYVRVQLMQRPKKAAAYFARQAQAKAAEVRTLEKTTWIDTLRMGSQKDRRRSIDIRITRNDDFAADAADADTDVALTIDILVVEIKDPTKD